MRIAIIDYGMGNIKSLVSAFQHLNYHHILITSNFSELKKSDKLVLPGVGAFNKAMMLIKQKELDKALQDLVLGDKKSILGICLGMQLLTLSSSENGFYQGLAYIDAKVIRLGTGKNIKIPHVGYNQVVVNADCRIYYNMSGELDFYFVHSYKVVTETDISQSFCHYGDDFIASFECDNIAGVQFHPEISQVNGLKLLKNFATKI